jgi:DNA-binding NtrC family response regulator
MIAPCPSRKPVVLLVEDEVLVRMSIAQELEHEGFDVIQAADAEEGLQAFCMAIRVTTLFTDINMPGSFDGLSLAHQIARLRPDVQLILTSGRGEPAAADMPAGVCFLQKPYDCRLLTRLIEKPAEAGVRHHAITSGP